ncbi:uncharacterized protein LOC131316317 [Rhododendron vialii]|uniref:uncharacterized protein LOC131316317 n=1 Tax=Rhododendron vialii TaxID=182163 RepID=UPI00265F8561|nr:uncharacterized protein LOC131316317 [Rhododendron vialii]
MGTITTLINATRTDIQIWEYLVVDPTVDTGDIHNGEIRLSAGGAGATKRVYGRSYLHTDGQVSLLKICCEGQVSLLKICCDGTNAQTRPLIANDFIASRTITITQDPVNSQFVATKERRYIGN